MSRRSVDEHVVEMRFNNSDFEEKAKQSMSTLDKLKEKLNLNGSVKSADDLSSKLKGLNNITLDPLANSVKVLDVSFKAIAKNKLFETMADAAINAGKTITRALTKPFNQIVEGGKRRAQNIEQAKFQLKGLGIEWAKIEDDINYGVKDTAYGLDEAARAASQFVASGVQLGDEMKKALRGISGVAAMTNSSYSDIANIFTSISGNGRLMGMQLTQLATRGLNVAATLGKALGKSESEIREMVSKGQISFKQFSEAMDDAFGDHAKEANNTFEGALSNTKAALSRTGANVATAGFEGLRRILVSTIPVLNSLNSALKPIIGDNGIIYNGLLKLADSTAYWVSNFKDIIESDETTAFFKAVGEAVEDYFVVAVEKVEKGFEIIYNAIRNFIKGEGFAKVLDLVYNFSQLIWQPLESIKEGIEMAFSDMTAGKLTDFVDILNDFILKLWMSADAQDGLRNLTAAFVKKIVWVGKKLGEFLKFISPVVIWIRDLINEFLALFKTVDDRDEDVFSGIVKNDTITLLKKEFPAIIDNIKNKVKAFFNYFKKVFTKVKESEAFVKLIDKVKAGIDKILLAFQNFIKLLSGSKKLDTVFTGFKSDDLANAIITVIDWLNKGIEGVQSFFGLFTGVGGTIDDTTGSVNGLADGFKNLKGSIDFKLFDENGNFIISLEKIKDLFAKAGEGLFALVLYIQDGLTTVLENVDIGKILGEMFGVITVILSWNFVKLTQAMTKAANGIGGFFSTLKNRIKGIKDIKLSSFLSVVGAIIGLILALVALGIACEKYKDGMTAAFGIFVIISVLVGILYFMSKKFTGIDKSLSKTLGAVSSVVKAVGLVMIGMAALVAVLSYFKDYTAWIAAVGSALIFFVAIGALFFLANQIGKNGKTAIASVLGILAIAVLMVDILAVVAILSFFPSDKIYAVTTGLMVLILSLAVLAYAAKDIGGRGLLALLIVLGTILAIGYAVFMLAALPWEDMQSSILDPMRDSITTFVGALVGIFVALLFLNKMGQGMALAGLGVLAIVGALALLALTLVWFSSFSSELKFGPIALLCFLFTATMVILAGLVEEIGAMGIDEKKTNNLVKMLLAMTGVLIGISAAIVLLSRIPKQALGSAFVGWIMSMIAFAGLIALFTHMLKDIRTNGDTEGKELKNLAILIFATVAVVGVMAAAMSTLATVVDKEGLMMAATAMLTSLLGVAAVLYSLSKIDGDWKSVLKVFFAMLGVLALVGAVAKALYYLSQHSWENVSAVAFVLLGTIAGLALILYAINEYFPDVDIKKLGLVLGGMGILTLIIGALAFIGTIMKDLNAENFLNQLLSIAFGLAAFTAIALLFGSSYKEVLQGALAIAALVGVTALAGVAAAAMGWGLSILIPQLEKLGQLDFNYIIANWLSLLGTSIVLAAAGILMSNGAVGFALVGLALIVFAKGLEAVMPYIQLLANTNIEAIAKNFVKVIGIAAALYVASMILMQAAPGLLVFGVALLVVGAALLLFAKVAEKVVGIITAISTMGDTAHDAGENLTENLVDGVEDGLKNADTEDIGKKVAGSIMSGIFGEGGITGDTLKKGLGKALDLAFNAATSGGGVGFSTTEGSAKFGKGIGSVLEGAISGVGSDLFKNLFRGDEAEQLEGQLTSQLGGSIDLGSIFNTESMTIDTEGIQNQLMSSLGGSIDVGNLINMEGYDFTGDLQQQIESMGGGNLDITPVMNWDNTNFASLDSFNQIFSGGEAKMNVEGTVDAIVQDQKDYTGNINGLKTEVSNLRRDVQNLDRNMSNMKVYLDGKTLVGGLSSRMAWSMNKGVNQYRNQTGQVKTKTLVTASR